MRSQRPPLTPFAVSPADAARLAGVGRTTIYEALNSGALPSFRIGRRRLILVVDLLAWVRSHAVRLPPDEGPNARDALPWA